MNREEMLDKIGSYLILNLYNYSIVKNILLEEISELIESLSISSIELLKSNRFITSSEVQAFIKCLPKFLMQIESSSEKYYEKGFNIKGNINWGLTIKEQMNSGEMPYYVYSVQKKKFDNPSNQVLKWTLLRIREVCKEFINNFESNCEIFSEREELEKTLKEVITNTLKEVNTGLNLDFIGNVSSLKHIPENYIISMKKTYGYSELINVYKLYVDMIKNNNNDLVNKYLINSVLEPVDNNTLFELYVLFTTMNAIEQIDGVQMESLEVLGQRETPIAIYKYNSFKLKIWYQCVPYFMKENSNYKTVIKSLGLENVQTRRPDIIVSLEDGGKKYRFIIEVKHTEDKSYILDSVYKMFGYFKDFDKSFSMNNDLTKGILVVNKGINSYTEDNSEIWVITHDKIIESIQSLVISAYSIINKPME